MQHQDNRREQNKGSPLSNINNEDTIFSDFENSLSDLPNPLSFNENCQNNPIILNSYRVPSQNFQNNIYNWNYIRSPDPNFLRTTNLEVKNYSYKILRIIIPPNSVSNFSLYQEESWITHYAALHFQPIFLIGLGLLANKTLSERLKIRNQHLNDYNIFFDK